MCFGVQCAIPVFEGLLPEPHNSRLLDLLFVVAEWHGLAKLRIHTDRTLEILDQFTTLLGQSLRDFLSKTCSTFDTKELPREANARERRKKNKKPKESQDPATPNDGTVALGPTETSAPHDPAPILASDQTLNEPENTAVIPPSMNPPGILILYMICLLLIISLTGPPPLPVPKKKGKKDATSKCL